MFLLLKKMAISVGLLLVICKSSLAREEVLVEILSEPENNLIHQLVLDLSEEGIIGNIIRRSIYNSTSFTVEQMRESDVVLAKAEERDVVYIGCEECDSERGGHVRLKYLYNGMTDRYKVFSMTIERRKGQWLLFTRPYKGQREQIKKLRLRSRKVGGVLIGIRKIEVNR